MPLNTWSFRKDPYFMRDLLHKQFRATIFVMGLSWLTVFGLSWDFSSPIIFGGFLLQLIFWKITTLWYGIAMKLQLESENSKFCRVWCNFLGGWRFPGIGGANDTHKSSIWSSAANISVGFFDVFCPTIDGCEVGTIEKHENHSRFWTEHQSTRKQTSMSGCWRMVRSVEIFFDSFCIAS